MKNIKKDKKFSFLKEYKKSMENPLITAYKIQISTLQDCYIDELKKNKEQKKINQDLLNANKELHDDIVNLCKHILLYCYIKDQDIKIGLNVCKKYEKYFAIAKKSIKNENK